MADYFEEMGWQPLADGEAPDSLLHFARLLRDFGMFDVLGEDKKLPPPAAKEAVKNLEEKKCSDADMNQESVFAGLPKSTGLKLLSYQIEV
ncbi:hypothetical protein LSTR_LSTR017126 [Laodelphax striatellus]|uniref:Uncharacterized protein n=1 Tax=Laodelphax striatellus TaxID=195883 RepID=A0A482WV59_LAOST|nr:hypothetical protein LSTR_LSTR017126 [Laodelphax striatellus]